MSKLRYSIPLFLTAFLIYGASYLTANGSTATIYSPHCIIGMLPVMIFPFGVIQLIGILTMPLIFLIWTLPLAKGEKKIPKRTDIIAFILIILSFAYFKHGWSFGEKYQGIEFVRNIFRLNILFWATLFIVNIINKKYPSYITNLLFHGLFFIWLVWIAFPWLGESI